jgi:hypothetical protein
MDILNLINMVFIIITLISMEMVALRNINVDLINMGISIIKLNFVKNNV